MHPRPRRTLRQLLTDYGPALLDEPARLDALLADLCGPYHRERFLLVHALRARIPAGLFAQPQDGAVHGRRLAQRLQERYDFSAEAAQWAVESWALALNITLLNPLRDGDGGRTALSECPQLALCQLLADHGPALLDEPARVNALLADLCGPDHRERFILTHALRERIPAKLFAQPQGGALHGRRLSQRLQDRYGFSAEAAQWAVASWSMVGDCATLLGIRDALAGDGCLNWSAQIPVHEWEGVDVDRSTHPLRVTGLWLLGKGLTGIIPAELGSLSNLKELDLSDNQLTGVIPVELGSLSNLEVLRLYDNQLTGVIPAELGRLTNLGVLYLAGNKLSGCVPEVWRNVQHNDLAGLDLPFCDARSPTSTASIRQSESPPPGVVADAEDNPGLVEDCATLLGIRDALAGDGRLNWSAQIPVHEWEGVSIDTSTHPLRVTGLRLGRKGLTGVIPAELGRFTDLRWLSLYGNKLTGVIPVELGRLSNLKRLWLSDNQLTGEIPAELGSLSNLEGLSLDRNKLTGEIPAELGSLSNLWSLRLHGNKLTGIIPAELGSLSNLKELWLSGNQLTGVIPAELSRLSNLSRLNLSDNQLSGCIPEALRGVGSNDLSKLGLPFYDRMPLLALCSNGIVVADAEDNPGLVEDCATLLGIRDALAGNGRLNWSAQISVHKWKGVRIDTSTHPLRVTGLWLYKSGLTGEIPAELGSLSNLKRLQLSGNQLTGVIPAELGSLSNLEELNLDWNRLTGVIPAELGSLSNLKELSLFGNGLTGVIPAELGSLSNLKELSLSDNQLTGVIPAELGRLTNLGVLYLAGNKLSGCVPEVWRNVQRNDLAGLDLPFCDARSPTSTAAIRQSESPPPGVVADAEDNPGLVEDCATLLGIRDALAGDSRLNWSAQISIRKWEGVHVDRSTHPLRVTGLHLFGKGLMGEIPAELGSLSNLERLWLGGNKLTGVIPAELGSLSNLEWLRLSGNRLTGEIPAELGRLTNLDMLYLANNKLSGCVPEVWRNVQNNDLARLGLPFCDARSSSSSTPAQNRSSPRRKGCLSQVLLGLPGLLRSIVR